MQIVINGIKVVFDFPWLVLGSKELDPAEVSALERALSTSAGRRYLEQANEQANEQEYERGT
jgi:hypothetical protein